MMLQKENQSKKWWLGLIGLVVVITAVTVVLQLRSQPTELVPADVPADLSAVEDTSPLPEIDPALINCSNWIKLEQLQPGMVVTGPAVIFPYIAPRELALALGVKWRPRWGYSIFADQTVVIPESVIDRSIGETVQPAGHIRYFTDDSNLTIAEVSHFAEECT